MKTDLTEVVRRYARSLFRQLPKARRGQPAAVHQARVASRRLRELLPVAATATPGAWSAVEGALRRVTRALGAVREMDVAIAELEATTPRDWSATLRQRMKCHLVEERDRRERHMQARLSRLNLKRLPDRMKTLGADAAEANDGRVRAFLGARLRKRARRFATALDSAGTLYLLEPIHDVRIAGKKLRYTLEVARVVAGAPLGRDVATLKRLQDLLGQMHDLQMLQARIRQVAAESADDPALRIGFDGMQRDLETECRALHGQFLGRVRRLGALADRVSHVAAGLPLRKPARIAKLPPTTTPRAHRSATA